MNYPRLGHLRMGGLATVVCSIIAVSALAQLSVIDAAYQPDSPSLNFGAQELDNLALRSSAILAEAGLTQPSEHAPSSNNCTFKKCFSDADCDSGCDGFKEVYYAQSGVLRCVT